MEVEKQTVAESPRAESRCLIHKYVVSSQKCERAGWMISAAVWSPTSVTHWMCSIETLVMCIMYWGGIGFLGCTYGKINKLTTCRFYDASSLLLHISQNEPVRKVVLDILSLGFTCLFLLSLSLSHDFSFCFAGGKAEGGGGGVGKR